MLKKSAPFLFLLLLAAFVAGIEQLFELRLEDGDVYPPYSSLRADPLGSRALYESLEQQPGLKVARLYEPLPKVGSGKSTTLLLLGTPAAALESVPEHEVGEMEQFMREGGRVLLSLPPENTDPANRRGFSRRPRRNTDEPEREDDAKAKKKGKDVKPAPDGDKEKPSEKAPEKKPAKKKKKKGEDDDEMAMLKLKSVALAEVWGFKFKYDELPVDTNNVTQSVEARRQPAASELPDKVNWHTALYFDGLHKDWQIIYARGGHAVLLERRFGRGSLVLSADSYYLSNEALRKERSAGLLVWMLGPSSRIYFDETHLGVSEEPGIAALVRKYRLHGLVLGLVLLAALFIWKNATSFVPPFEEAAVGSHELVAGKDSAAGFVNLLRRNVPPADILNVCIAEWKKSGAHRRADVRARAARIEALVAEENARPAAQRNPVAAYQAIARILTERR